MNLPRPHLQQRIEKALARSQVVALLGPRQSGKTTLARGFVPPGALHYFDLEDPVSLARLAEPMTALQGLRGLVVIDEIQRMPALFAILRVLADRQPLPCRFLVLGSASPDLIKGAAESLAGRIELIPISGFHLREVGANSWAKHALRGGFPRAFLAESEEDSLAWRGDFIRTFLERDLPMLRPGLSPQGFFRFWRMLAHYHGQVWNSAEPARALGISESTVRRYLELLEGTYLIRVLSPWHANLGKRQVKSPKIYIRDTGLLHHLLGIRTELELQTHPKVGASWEGYAIEEILAALEPEECYFWRTQAGAELDLLVVKNGHRHGFECKRSDAPRATPSMKIALADLDLEDLQVIYPGDRAYPLGERLHAVPLRSLA